MTFPAPHLVGVGCCSENSIWPLESFPRPRRVNARAIPVPLSHLRGAVGKLEHKEVTTGVPALIARADSELGGRVAAVSPGLCQVASGEVHVSGGLHPERGVS